MSFYMGFNVFIIITLAIFCFGLVSHRLQHFAITPPMIFVLVGLVTGPLVLDLVHIEQSAFLTQLLASFTLVLVLFIDAMQIDRKGARTNPLPRRMLLIGLPLTILFGTLIAKGIFTHIPWWQAAIIAILLTPTDAALGQAVVTNHAVPYRLREALNVESGLNDGLTLAALLIVLSVGGQYHQAHGFEYWLGFISMQLLVGIALGVIIGYFGGKLIDICSQKEWMFSSFQSISAIVLALLTFALSEVLYGNGFISVFCAGLMLGVETPKIRERLVEFGETEGQGLALITFIIFGGALLPKAFPQWDWWSLLYALLSLTVVRMGAVAISLIGLKEKWKTIAFLGWFGPRGLSSILFSLLIILQSPFDGSHYLLSVVGLTIFISIFAHGITSKFAKYSNASTAK